MDKFAVRAKIFMATKGLGAEYCRRRDQVTAVLGEELGVTKEDLRSLPDETKLGAKSADKCRAWINWLTEKDPDGTYTSL